MADHPAPHPDLGGYVVGGLAEDEREVFEGHLATCDDCRREVDELAALTPPLLWAAPPLDAPADLEDRVLAAVRAAGEREASSPPPAPSPITRPHRRRPRRMVPLGRAAAVTVAVALLAGAVGAAIRDDPNRAAAPAATTTIPATTTTTTVAGTTLELQPPPGRTGRGLALISSSASGRVIDLEVEGLAVPPPGSFYECWLISPDGDSIERPNRVSVGTFTVDATGRARVRWHFEADTTKFSQMGITLEPDDGNPAQTADRVLRATSLIP